MNGPPILAIVGRPNVGKSALFNRILAKRIAIVDEAEGVTRDRLYGRGELFGRPFILVDTGGIDTHSKALFNEEIRRQAEIAVEEADGLVLCVDSQVGPTDLDLELARVLLKKGKPLALAVNKIDTPSQQDRLHAFHSLGISAMVAVSATQGHQMAELLQAVLQKIPEREAEALDPSTKVAIIGRANVGKSTLINALLDEERCIVSPIPGTTRDSIDTPFTYEGEAYTLIDTAGIRRKSAEHEVVDKFAAIRTEQAIERADLCILMIDSVEGLTTQEKRIATQIEEAGKGCILLFNKWDLIKGTRMEHAAQAVRMESPFLNHCPLLFISAKTGRKLDELLPQIQIVAGEAKKRISTAQLNRFVEEAMQEIHPPMIRGKRLRIYYTTQVGTSPPRFLCFVNHADLMAESYRRYLLRCLRKAFTFTGNPVIFDLKGKSTEERTPPPASSELAVGRRPRGLRLQSGKSAR
ncbi:MAG: ribosome biogenesis GTPase Der [Parachlamydiales bacterium]